MSLVYETAEEEEKGEEKEETIFDFPSDGPIDRLKDEQSLPFCFRPQACPRVAMK